MRAVGKIVDHQNFFGDVPCQYFPGRAQSIMVDDNPVKRLVVQGLPAIFKVIALNALIPDLFRLLNGCRRGGKGIKCKIPDFEMIEKLPRILTAEKADRATLFRQRIRQRQAPDQMTRSTYASGIATKQDIHLAHFKQWNQNITFQK